jgi:hypothetical protein
METFVRDGEKPQRLALVPRLRPWLWTALLGMHLALIALIAFADLSLGMVTFHLFVADPDWLRSARRRLARPLSRSRG